MLVVVPIGLLGYTLEIASLVQARRTIRSCLENRKLLYGKPKASVFDWRSRLRLAVKRMRSREP